MSPEMLEKRNALKNLSEKVITASIGTANEGLTVNDLLMIYAYNPLNKLIFKSFKAWQHDGMQVKKGSKAFLLWGEPVKSEKGEAQTEPPQAKATGDKPEKYAKFFPLAFVFSSEQVEPIKIKNIIN